MDLFFSISKWSVGIAGILLLAYIIPRIAALGVLRSWDSFLHGVYRKGKQEKQETGKETEQE